MKPHHVLKITLLLMATLLNPETSPAQSLGGTWQGAIAGVQNPQQEFPASMTLRVAGSKLTGTETYRINAQTQGTQAAGTVTDVAAGTVMEVEMAFTNGKLVVAFGHNNTPTIMGVFTQGGSAGAGPQAQRTQPATCHPHRQAPA